MGIHKHTASDPAPAPAGPLYITEEAAAARYSVSLNTIRRMRYSGKITAIAIGAKLVRLSVASLDAYFAGLALGGGVEKKGIAKGACSAWRARRNLRPKTIPAKSAGTASGDAATANA